MDADPVPPLKLQVAAAIKTQMVRYYDPAAALLMRIDRARVSDIRRGRLRPFSLETLIRYADRIGLDVELRIERRRVGEAMGPGA